MNVEGLHRVKAFLAANNIQIVDSTLYNEYIIVKAPINTWEKVLHTEFYEFVYDNHVYLRCYEYFLESSLNPFIHAIFNTVHLPTPLLSHGPKLEDKNPLPSNQIGRGTITPDVLNEYYNITFNDGNKLGSQCVFAALKQYYSPNDLKTFTKNYNIPTPYSLESIGGYVSDSECTKVNNACALGNLNVEYLVGIAQNIPTTYWYTSGREDIYLEWIIEVSNSTSPPLVNAISYSGTEVTTAALLADAFEAEALKLGVQGVSK